jgi:hypothetical protein
MEWHEEAPMRTGSTLVGAVLLALAASSYAQINPSQLFKSGSDKQLSNGDIVAGLKEALEVGTTNTVDLTGKVDGYFGNQAIKILLPKQLQSVEQGLRVIGQGAKVDEFVLSMNRAAEKAAPAAKDIFWGAIKSMSFDDARGPQVLGARKPRPRSRVRGRSPPSHRPARGS